MDYAAARRNMVESQVRTNKVTSKAVVDALLTVPRELFVPPAKRPVAYVDEDLALGHGRFLMEPMVLARLLQFADLEAGERLLDVGCATGYSSAVASRLVKEVVALDSDPALADAARAALAELHVGNVSVTVGPLAAGPADAAPFDAVLIPGAVAEVPEALCRRLADRGRLLTVVKHGPGMGQAVLVERIGDGFSRRPLFDAATPLLPEFVPQESFVF